ncbi:MAG: tripartite tricarboxylate transporter substrate binding protein [Burkholderiales bacterium]
MRFFSNWVAVLVLLALAPLAVAQDYPVRAVRIITPYAPGGSADVLTRIASQQLTARWGQSVVVDNRAGASGNIGAELGARAAPDGYTLLVAGAPHAINMSLFKKLQYNLEKDYAHISPIATFPAIVVVHPSLPVKTVKDLVALAKARPGELNFASPNNGSPNHLVIELVKSMAKVNMAHIPYKGGSGGQMIGDLLAGQVQLASLGLPPAAPLVKSGRLRAIAVTSAKRSALLPEVPTVSESGLPGFDLSSWYGVLAPAGTPRTIVTKVNADIVAFLGSGDVKTRLASLGAEAAPMSPDDFARYVRDEVAKWAKLVQASGARVE